MNQRTRDVQNKYDKSASDKYNPQASRSLSAICDNWEDKWLQTKEKLGSNHPTLNKGTAARAMLNMIIRHIKNYEAHDINVAIEYLHRMIFQTVAPQSITRGTIISENDYFSFLSELYNEYNKATALSKANALQENHDQ